MIPFASIASVSPGPNRRLLLGDSSSQVDRPPRGPGPRSCVGTRLATTIGAPLSVSRGEELCGMSAGSGQPPPVVGIAQIWRSACTGGRLCRVRLALPGGGEARGLSRRGCASRSKRERCSRRVRLSYSPGQTEVRRVPRKSRTEFSSGFVCDPIMHTSGNRSSPARPADVSALDTRGSTARQPEEERAG
jgi:hypothetical protein